MADPVESHPPDTDLLFRHGPCITNNVSTAWHLPAVDTHNHSCVTELQVFKEGENPKVSEKDYHEMLNGELFARLSGTPWQLRGPPGLQEPADGAQFWRGQRFRPFSGKWANRGGRNRDHYNWNYGYGQSPQYASTLYDQMLDNWKSGYGQSPVCKDA